MEQIRWGQGRGLRIFAETCPQYLVLTADHLDAPGFEGAKYVCSPPPRDVESQEAIWRGLASGVFHVFSSDHAAFRFDHPEGKKRHGTDAPFKKVPNGVPGVETRLPILFSEGVNKGRIDLGTFVALTATNPAKLYGLYPRKGSIAVGADADLVIWDKDREVVITNDKLHHNCDYTPYEGMSVRGWPAVVFSRGEIVVEEGKLLAQPGQGQFLRCDRPPSTRTDPIVISRSSRWRCAPAPVVRAGVGRGERLPRRQHRSGSCLSSRPSRDGAVADRLSPRDVDAPEHRVSRRRGRLLAHGHGARGAPSPPLPHRPRIARARPRWAGPGRPHRPRRACRSAPRRDRSHPRGAGGRRRAASARADRSRVDARDTPARSGATASRTGASREVAIGALDEIAGPPERRDHAREALGRRARGERLVHPGEASAWSRARPPRTSISVARALVTA